jgi:nickel-dependent lactate racemase
MISASTQAGQGALTEADVAHVLAEALDRQPLDGKRMLVLIPDHTRTAPVPLMVRTVHGLLAGRTRKLDFMVALGTHAPLDDEALGRLVGIPRAEWETRLAGCRLMNHCWNDPAALTTLGVINAAEMGRLSEGLLRRKVPVSVNRAVLDYDTLLILGPTYPHEVAGFSGGNKYFFPGIAGPEIIDTFHWLGALITSMAIIGVKDNPVRRVIDRAAAMLPAQRLCISMVVGGTEGSSSLAALCVGSPEAAYAQAADLSAQLHVVTCRRPFARVLSCAPPMYDDLWTAAKCMYKLEPVVEDGGELIVHAPHVTQLSPVHGALIHRIGYHVRDYFLAQWHRFARIPGGVLAHSTHLKGTGTYEDGRERPRIRVTLATGIPKEVCEQVNLGYLDPAAIDPRGWAGREAEGLLLVPHAGERLYRLADPADGRMQQVVSSRVLNRIVFNGDHT